MLTDLKIGGLAKQTICQVEVIRHYEQRRLLSARTLSQFLWRCRSPDMKHNEIRSLLWSREHPEDNCSEFNQLLYRHIGHAEHRLAVLNAPQSRLPALRMQCHVARAAKDCAILQSVADSKDGLPTSLGTDAGKRHQIR